MFNLVWQKLENTGSRDAFYYAATITRVGSGKSLFIKAWGKRGSKGQAKIYQCASPGRAAQICREAVTEKLSRGYRTVDTVNYSEVRWDALEARVPRLLEYILLNHRTFLGVSDNPSIVTDRSESEEEAPFVEPKVLTQPEGYGSW